MPRRFAGKPSVSFFTGIMPFTLVNLLVSLAVSWPIFMAGNGTLDAWSRVVAFVPFVSHYFMLSLLPGLVIWGMSCLAGKTVVMTTAVILSSLFHALIIIDTRIYTIFHFHINSLVWNIVVTEGASDSIMLGKGTLATFMGIMAVITAFVWAVIRHTVGDGSLLHDTGRFRRTLRASKILFAAGVLLLIADKGMYAWADLHNNTDITKNAKLYPLYQPLTVKRIASKVFGIDVNREDGVSVQKGGGMLNYPKHPLRFENTGKPLPNIVVIVIDGLRADMMDMEIMPNAVALGGESLVFGNHFSGGNGTRFGIFSLFYGIQGTYWHNFLGARRSPALMDTLIDKGYEFKILSSTKLTFPEFRKTVFARVPESIEDEVSPEDASVRDRIITERFVKFAAERSSGKPFFSFIFYDSTHLPIRYPPAFEKFRPTAEIKELNFFRDIGPEQMPVHRNRYMNAAHYDDSLTGEVVAALKKNGLFDNTIVLVTGDHGDEFFENGYFGHTSSFDDYQVRTPFVLHMPGESPAVVTRMTSHLDFVPTLMEAIGCVSPPGDYSQGLSLLRDNDRRFVSISNWDNAAVVGPDVRIVFSTETYNMSTFEFRRGSDYRLLDNTPEIMSRHRAELVDQAKRMSEFYR